MPFSLKDQMRLMGPHLFQDFCTQVVKCEHKNCVKGVNGVGGDEGIDIFSGEMNKQNRKQTSSRLHVWQVKSFRDGVKSKQREQIKKSLDRVIYTNHPESWTLCINVDLDVNNHKWFQELCGQHPDITCKLMQASDLEKYALRDNSLIESYFLPSSANSASVLTRLDDFDDVSKLLESAHSKPMATTNYYDGVVPCWSDIAQHLDAPRIQLNKIWTKVVDSRTKPSGKIPFILITGRSGDGKTTLLMRLAAELAEQDCKYVFYCKDDTHSLRAEQLCEIPSGDILFVLIDKITRFNSNNLRGFFERLHRQNVSAIIIGAALKSVWEGLRVSLDNVASVYEISVEEMTDDDIDALIDKLSVDPINLGTIANLTREQQLAVFREKANRQLLVALLECKYSKAFESTVYNELENLKNSFGNDVYRACIYVSALHRFDIPMPRSLLQKLLPSVDLDEILSQTHGLLHETFLTERNLITRHPLVAKTVLDTERDERRIYETILNGVESHHKNLTSELLHNLVLHHKNDLANELFEIAHRKFPDNIALLHMNAMLAQQLRNLEKANALFQKAITINPNDVYNWQAWAIMEKEQRNIERARELFQKATSIDSSDVYIWQAWAIMEKEQRNIERARELFQRGVDANPTSAPLYHAWAIMEKEQRNIERARELFQKGVDANPKHAPLYQAWAIMEKEQRNIERARELFQKAVTINPNDVYNWQAWARMEKEQRNIERARELFQKAVTINPNDVYNWQAWAIMEKEQRNIERARELFQKGVDADPKHAPLYHAWARMEKEQHNIERARELFQKTTTINPNDGYNWQAWAIMEKEQRNIERARELFQRGVDANPTSAPLYHAWAIMEKEQHNIERARELFQKGVDANPKHAPLYQAWAIMEKEQRNIERARELFQKAVTINPNDVYNWQAWAMLEDKEENWLRAAHLYSCAIKWETETKERARLCSHCSRMHRRLGNVKEEENCLLQAIECDPKYSLTHAFLGRLYGFQKEWEKAEHHFLISLDLNPGDEKTKEWYEKMKRARR